MIEQVDSNRQTSPSSSPTRPGKILLADDGSEHAQAAVALLCDLPLPSESIILALAVVPTLDIARHEMLQRALDRTEGILKQRGFQVVTELKGGVPAATINEYAHHNNPDLIIIGAKGLRATLGILLGGVAQQVVEYSNVPVLVVRAPYLGIRRVLVVSDGSPYSQCAMEYLGSGARREDRICEARLPLPTDSDVRVMHVLPPALTPEMIASTWSAGPDMFFPMPPESIDEKAIQEEEEQQGQALLSDAVQTLKAGGIQAGSLLVRGDAATEIINYVKAHNIDLIVCGSRGLSQVAGWLLGSVSRKLVHYAGCSVLIVKSSTKPHPSQV